MISNQQLKNQKSAKAVGSIFSFAPPSCSERCGKKQAPRTKRQAPNKIQISNQQSKNQKLTDTS
jgi:hypothetical protein